MAEFVLVLPLLALLTFGTIEVAIYLQQQSTLTAAAFLASRSASVLANEAGPTKASVQGFASDTGAGWLQEAVAGMKASHNDKTSGYKLEARTDRLSGMIDALTNGEAKGFDTLTAQAQLPLEYDHGRVGQRSATSVAKTHFMINYDSKPVPMNPNPIALGPANIAAIQKQLAGLLNPARLTFVVHQPANGPGVTPVPPAPRPHAESSSSPRPRPKPSGHPGPGPGPGPKPTPQPTPVAVTGHIEIPIPGIPGIEHLKSAGHEPYRKETAVIPNPHARNDSGDGSQFTSSQYLEPGYENRQDANYKLDKMLKELGEYNPNDLMKSSQAFGAVRLDYPPLPGPQPPELVAAWAAWAKINIDGPRKAAAKWADGIGKGADQAYKNRLELEQRIFNK
jgi:hypothetical protein